MHPKNMKVAYVHVDRQPNTVHYCERCGKFMVSPEHCKDLRKMLKKGNALLSLKEWKSNQIKKERKSYEKNNSSTINVLYFNRAARKSSECI